MFQFKQFSVDQTGCAMKINTDGVLLGAMAEADNPGSILDIGTGTGVIALILAQRFTSAQIDAVEIDPSAAHTATKNFANSTFAARLKIFSTDFQCFFKDHPSKKYDIIISNPPFHLNALKSTQANKSLAKHTGQFFFEDLIEGIKAHLTEKGLLWLILPSEASSLVKKLALQLGLCLQQIITIHSFENDIPHREIIVISLQNIKIKNSRFVIYDEPKVYSKMYVNTLKDFFTIF